TRSVNQAAQQRLVFDDPDVLLNILDAGKAISERSHVSDAADCFNLFVLAQLFSERDEINGTAGFSQLHHSQIDATVGVERKMVGEQVLRGLAVGEIVEENGAKNSPFSIYAGRQTAVKTVISCRHSVFLLHSSEK